MNSYLKIVLKFIRFHKLPTYFLGPFYSTNSDRLEIALTYDCNLKCLNCNRSCRQAPAHENMRPSQIGKFINESIQNNKKWQRIVLMGGEPTLHPDILDIIHMLGQYIKQAHTNTTLVLATNGYGEIVNSVLKEIPSWVEINNSRKVNAVQNNFYPFNLAPMDSRFYKGIEYKNKCYVTSNYGMGLSKFGYYICSNAAGIDRVFGFDMGRKTLPLEKDEMVDQAKALCRYCGNFIINKNLAKGQELSHSWKAIYKKYNTQKPIIKKYGSSPKELI